MFRQNKWRNGLAILGLVGLGYFAGRPDQLQQLTQGLSHWTNNRYVVPTTVQTVPVHRQPIPTIAALPPQVQAWSRFSPAGGGFSVMMPSATPTESVDANGKHFSVESGLENYFVSYNDQVPNIHLLTVEGKQVLLDQMPKRLKLDDLIVVGQRSFAMNGHPGVEVRLKHTSPDLPKAIMRYMIVGNRMYTFGVASNDSQKVKFFFDSFQLN